MWRLARISVRHRASAFVATFVAVLLGAVIVSACAALMETGIRLDVAPQRLAAAPILVTGDPQYVVPAHGSDAEDRETQAYPERHRLERDVADRVAAVPGVSAVVGEISVAATVLVGGHPVTNDQGSLGHEWSSARLAPFRLQTGHAPRGPTDVVVDSSTSKQAGIEPGDRIQVAVGGQVRSVRLSGVASAPHPGLHPAIFFADGALRGLAASADSYDAIGVFPRGGVDVSTVARAVRDAAPSGATALTGGDRGLAEFPEAVQGQSQIIPLAGVFGGMAVFVCAFVVANTLGLTVRQREREMGLLRSIGASRRQVRRLVVGEGVSVGLVAAVLGAAGGVVAGPWLYERIAGAGVISPAVAFHAGPLSYLVGPAVALLVTMVSARVAARRAGRVSPLQALVASSGGNRVLSGWRAVIALVFLSGGVVLAALTATVMSGPVASSTAGPSVMCFALGLAALAPALTKLAAILLTPLLRFVTRTTGRLAAASVRARAAQVAGVVTPVMLAVGVGVGIAYTSSTQSAAAEKWYAGTMRPDVVVSSGADGFTAAAADRLRSVDGVGSASAYATTGAWIEEPFDPTHRDDPWPVQGIDGSAAAITGIRASAGSLSALSGATVALPVSSARRMHVGVGDRITMRFGDAGTSTLRIVALFPSRPGWATMYVPTAVVTAHTTSGLARQLLVAGDGTVSASVLRSRVAAQVGDLPAARVGGRSAFVGPAGDSDTQQWVNILLIGLITGYALIAVVNNLVAATAARRRELGMHRLIGASRGQVRRLLVVEAVLVAGVGIALGTVVAFAAALPFSASALGRAWPAGPMWLYPALAATTLVLTLGGTLLPVLGVLRQRPAEAAAVGLD